MSLYDHIFKPKKYRLANGKEVEERFTRLPLIDRKSTRLNSSH